MKLSEVFADRRSGYWGGEAATGEVDVRAIRNGDVGLTGTLRWKSLPLRGFSAKEVARARVHAGDVVVTTSANCGNVAFIAEEPHEPTAATNFVKVLRVDPAVVDAKYAFHFLRTAAFMAGIAPFVRGATIKNLSVDAAFDVVDMPVPPLVEQRRIAAILDHADTLRLKRRQVLAHLDTLTRSIFHEMFGQAPPRAAVEQAASLVRTGPFGSQLLHSEFVAEGIAVLGLDNVVSNRFRWGQRRFITPEKYQKLARYTVRPGDVLISIMGTTGRCVVVPEDIPPAINTKHICAITPDPHRLVPEFLRGAFLWHAAARAHLQRQTKGSIMDGLNMGIIKAMPIPLPPMEQQEMFRARVGEVSRQVDRLEAAQQREGRLFASLQSRAFRGEL